VTFDHALTGFALEGAHERQSCTSCHEPIPDSVASRKVVFTGLAAECISCHENVHRDQFETNGVTDCTRCHDFSHWRPSTFDHNTARFVLEGAHITVACDQCHRQTVEEGISFTLYRIENFACSDCHE
jgi:hypothetical protein